MMNFNQYYFQNQGIKLDKVADLDSAKRYQMGANQTVYLLDENEPYLYFKCSDNFGKTTLRCFELVEINIDKIIDKRYVSKEDFEQFRNEILSAIRKDGATNE